MTIDAGGIQIRNPKWSVITENGVLTSNQRFIDIVAHERTIDGNNAPHYGLVINAVIADADKHKVGLRLTGDRPAPAYATVVLLQGEKSNTFTGDVVVSGVSNYLALGKKNGAIAVQGNILVSNRGILRFDEGQQVSRQTKITVNRGTIYFGNVNKNMDTRFHSVIIEHSGTISFGHAGTHIGIRKLYLDELVIHAGGNLRIVEWSPGRDSILVSKKMSRESLDAMLSQISFNGYPPGKTHLRSYDQDYWTIYGTPEPETYGAILGAVGLGLAVWRKRRRARSPQ